jgi:carboxyl-terminal processing protease
MLKFMKNKILIPLLIVGALAAFFSFKYSRTNGQTSEEKRKLVVAMVMKVINGGHYSPKELDDTFSARVFNKLVKEFDYDKLYFTQQDRAKMGAYEFKIDDEIKGNSIEFFDTLDAIYMRRAAGAEKYYTEILSKPFNFDGHEVLQLNPDKKDYAADEQQLKERWAQYLKYRVLAKYVDLKNDQEKLKEKLDTGNYTKYTIKAKGDTMETVYVGRDKTDTIKAGNMKTNSEMEAQAREDVKKNYDRYFARMHKWKDDDRFTAYVDAITETEDPHTQYFPPDDKKDFDVSMSGSFVGIGAKLSPENDKVTVSSIIVGSPAAHQGELKAGDEITKVGQGSEPPVDIQGYELNDVIKLIRGPKGTEVRLTVKRMDGSTKVIPIKRGVIEIEETFAKSAIIKSKDGPVGYIRLPEFYADFNHTSGRTCSADVAAEVKKLKEAGVTGIILDLRDNGGGSLGDVVDMAGIFVGKGPVVQVKNNSAAATVLRAQPNDSALYTGPLAIMVNENSASASEILAAAMQDYKRAVIVGANTYGKGTVQKMVELDQMVDPMTRLQMLNDSSGAQGGSIGAVKLTMEKFYRINGGSTQLKGVTPDITIPDAYDGYDEEELGERHNRSALAWDEIPAANYKTTNSLGNLKQLATLSESRIVTNPTFKLIEENAEIVKKKRDDNRVSLNEAEYKREQEELNATSKKLEELQKKAIAMDMTNPPADLSRINDDSISMNKNKDWLKALSKDIYISESVNIVNDLPKSTSKVNLGTGMK